MTRDQAATFAEQWAQAWNARDIERVLEHFTEDVTFTSPTENRTFGPDGFVVSAEVFHGVSP
jgi:uncharacterized protein (TIGR02246 family)